MSTRYYYLFLITSLVLLGSNMVFALEDESEELEEIKKTNFAIGFQISIPIFGMSGMFNLSEDVSIQGILGVLGDLKTYAGRGIYRFSKEPHWNVYGYGLIGALTYPTDETWGTDKIETETTLGLGIGIGFEYDMSGRMRFPIPLWANFEIGFVRINFDQADYKYETMTVGFGIHHRF